MGAPISTKKRQKPPSATRISTVSPGGGVRSVNVESANGVRVLGVPLAVR